MATFTKSLFVGEKASNVKSIEKALRFVKSDCSGNVMSQCHVPHRAWKIRKATLSALFKMGNM